MSKPIHTPGPAQLPTGFESASPDDHDGMPLFVNGNPFDTVAIVLPRQECNPNARLLAAAYNAFDSAARKLNLNAVECAERMAEGGIAELVEALELHHAAHVAFEHADDAEAERKYALAVKRTRAALAKVKGGAA